MTDEEKMWYNRGYQDGVAAEKADRNRMGYWNWQPLPMPDYGKETPWYPFIPTMVSKCSVCNIDLTNPIGFVCANNGCPSRVVSC